MQELQVTFTGRGETKGFLFSQYAKSNEGYIYRVDTPEGNTHYEVFKRKENTQYGCISYPTAKAFGIWAWTCKTLELAENKFNEL